MLVSTYDITLQSKLTLLLVRSPNRQCNCDIYKLNNGLPTEEILLDINKLVLSIDIRIATQKEFLF